MDQRAHRKRIIAEGYDRIGAAFSTWNSELPQEGRRWRLGEVLARLSPGSAVLDLGSGPGTDAAVLSARRRYVGIDLSLVQLSIGRQRVPGATFVVGDLASPPFRPASFDAIVAFYAFNHVPRRQVEPAFVNAFELLRPGG